MKKLLITLSTLILSFSLFSCMTIKDIPLDKSATQIIQMGQNAASSGSFSNAEYIYKTVIERFGDDPLTFVMATYELGHIYNKQEKYDLAEKAFNQVLDLYALQGSSLPQDYRKLCEIGLSKIPAPEER